MEKTRLIVEYLVAGTLIMISAALAWASYIDVNFSSTIDKLNSVKSPLINPVIISTIFIAAAYAIGIVAEFMGERCFEWLLTRIKKNRVTKFIKKNRSIIESNPIFEHFMKNLEVDWDDQELTDCIGRMRFFVMCDFPTLYADISAQINRLRLIRVLFIVEAILFVAVAKQLIAQFNADWSLITLIIVTAACVNWRAIQSRFGRYCRAVERSYLEPIRITPE